MTDGKIDKIDGTRISCETLIDRVRSRVSSNISDRGCWNFNVVGNISGKIY